MVKKYQLAETCEYEGRVLHRIVALKDFSSVKAGDKGGWIEKEGNLSQNDCCWVYDNAMVYDNAEVFCSAQVHGDAMVFGNAKVYDNAEVFCSSMVHGDAMVFGNAKVCGNAEVCGDAEVRGNAKVTNNRGYIVFKNWWSSGRYFTWTRSNNKWSVGCFYGTGEELIAKAYKDSELSGREYKRIVDYVNSIYKHNNILVGFEDKEKEE